MIYFILVIVAVGIFEVINMLKSGLKRETAIWICMAALTIAFGIFYFSNPFQESLASMVLHLFGINY